jgi:hypothetical protein
MTNNSQAIYLKEPTSVSSDDKTTFVFTQNMNRIMMGTGPTSQRANNEENDIDEKDQDETTTNKDPFGQIVQTMKRLPDSHEVWEYIDHPLEHTTPRTGNRLTLKTKIQRPSLIGMTTN